MSPDWNAYLFEDLDPHLLYAVMQLRQEVFVVEQQCWYLDADGKDQQAVHLVGTLEGRVVAYTRILQRGVSYSDYASIGRVVTSPAVRGRGFGRPLMEVSISELYSRYGRQPIKISAQAHLQDFYGSLGFVGTGDIYEEDGIPHRAMLLSVELGAQP